MCFFLPLPFSLYSENFSRAVKQIKGTLLLKQVHYSSHVIFFIKTGPFFDRGPFDRNSLDRNCVLSVDRNFDNQLTEFLDAFQLIETFNNDFGQTPKI